MIWLWLSVRFSLKKQCSPQKVSLGRSAPMFELLIFMKKQKFSSISEHLPSHLSAKRHWTVTQEARETVSISTTLHIWKIDLSIYLSI